MINDPTSKVSANTFQKHKDELAKSMNEANSIIKSLRRSLDEIRLFNKQARDYLATASRKLL